MSSPDTNDKVRRLVEKVLCVAPYVIATLPKPHDGHEERVGRDGSRWGDCHMGRAGSSVNQLEHLEELAKELRKELDG